MEVVNVQVTSTELIKPSRETPDHLRTVKLSHLDQLAPPNYFFLALLYESDGTSDDGMLKIHNLKKSLSETLKLFYPVAGRIDGSPFFSIDCDDTGVEFSEARVANKLSDVLQDSDPEELRKLLPAVSGDVLLAVQANLFACGGIAVAVALAHQTGDAVSLITFVKAWATACRGDQDINSLMATSFGTIESYFPVRDMSGYPFSSAIVMTDKALVTKRLVFDKDKLVALKELVDSSPSLGKTTIKDPTKVELISAFLWRFFVEVAEPHEKKVYAAVHAVNIRARTDPPHIFENAFGNCFFSAFALIEDIETRPHQVPTIHDLAVKLRDAIRKVDHEYTKEAQTGRGGYQNDLINACTAISEKEMDMCVFSSWCRFPVYEVNYGWGTPVCVSSPIMGINNAARLFTTKSGDGIEALVNLLPENAKTLEQKFQLLGAKDLNN